MPVDLKGYRVFIASPGGLDEERNAFRDAIEEYNRCDSIARNVQFIPIGWEETLGGIRRPQSIINDEVRKCDYFVMVLYDRWGTPPGQDGEKKYSSGTEEEYHVALECFNNAESPMRQIVAFFKSVDERRLSDPGEQLKKVLDFRKKLESEKTHLFHVYDVVDSFTIWLRRYLAQWVRDHEDGKAAKIKHPIEPYDEDAEQIKKMSKLETLEKKLESQEDEIKKLLKKAKKLADDGKITEAETTYSEAVVRSNSPAVINAYGNFLSRLGRLAQAEVMFKRVMEIAKNINDETWEATALGNLGLIYYTRGEWKKAEEIHLKSLEIEKKLGHMEGIAQDYGNLGLIYWRRGELDKAEKMYKKALKIDEKLGDQKGVASGSGNLGLIYETKGELDKAEESFLKILEIHEKLADQEGQAKDYGNLGVVYKQWEDLDKAEEMHKRALEIDEKLGDQEGIASDYGNLGAVYEERGDIGKAKEYWEKALGLYKKMGIPHMVEKMQGWIDSAGGGKKKKNPKS